MKTAKTPKFNWDEVSELNSGHTSDEWGITKKAKSSQNVKIQYEDYWNSSE